MFPDAKALFGRVVDGLRKHPRYFYGGLAAVVVVAIAVVGAFFVLHGGQNQVAVGPEEEPCTTESGGDRVGYLRSILLCSTQSLKCNPDQTQVFRARAAGNWSTQALMIPDIPDGYVISGGDVVDPSSYRIANEGFGGIKITGFTTASDYCTQHYWYYMTANHNSPEPEDRVRIRVCVYYDKWQGAPITGSCPTPTMNAQ